MNLIPDEIDLDAYLRSADDIRVLVKSAASFGDAIKAKFADRQEGRAKPSMFSTKLRNVIEFRPAEVTCWAGYNGHRKSMFAGQVALDLLVQHQNVLIASFEMEPAETVGRMARQALATAKPNAYEVDEFLGTVGANLSIFDHIGKISPERCLAVCRYFAEELGGQHVFIDSMMMVCASEEHLDEQKQFMTSLVRLAIETGMHVHLIAHCRKPQTGEDKPPGKYDLRGSAAISDQASNVVTVWMNKDQKSTSMGEPDAFITVEKQRNGAWEGRVKLWFDAASLRFVDDTQFAVERYAAVRP